MKAVNWRMGAPGPVLLALYGVMALLPVVLARAQDLPARPWRDELSSAMAMVGFSMLLMEFVLSGRFRIISGRIGIDVSMRFHRLAAYLLALLLIAHPWLYTLPSGAPRPWDHTGASSLALTGAPIGTGWAAWLMLILLVVWAAFRRDFGYRYETWRLCHGIGALLIALLGLHHALGAGRYSAGDLLAGLWVLMLAIAVATMLQVYLVGPLLQRRHPYRVVSVERAALRTWDLTIEPEHGVALPFNAGQFAWLTLDRSPFCVTEHPFSISSCPADLPRVTFTVKEAGDFTSRIGSTPIGARAYLDGPHGALKLTGRRGSGIAFIAGGVGLAPIMSMLRQAHADGERRPLVLIYGNRVEEQILFRSELERLGSELDLNVTHVLSEPPPGWAGKTGQLDTAMLTDCLPQTDRAHWLFVVCGPGPMIDGVEAGLHGFGVPRRQIVSEKFSYD